MRVTLRFWIFSHALELDPEFAEAFYNRVWNMQRRVKMMPTEGFFRALKINPAYTEAYNNRGVICARMGNLPEALENYALPWNWIPLCRGLF